MLRNFRSNHDLVTHGLEPFAHEIFVGVWTVHFRSIEERHAALNGGPDDRDAVFAAARSSVALADAHAAETKGRYVET
jgi:hypothetical protein